MLARLEAALEPGEPFESVRLVPLGGSADPTDEAGRSDERWAQVIDLRQDRRGTGADAPAPEAGYRWGDTETRVGSPEVEPALPAPYDRLPAVRFERAVTALATRTEILAARLERVEQRIEHVAEYLFDAATQADIIEVESRRARLAAEVARLSVELHAEIDSRLDHLARALARSQGSPRAAAHPPGPVVTDRIVDHLGPLDAADAERVQLHLGPVIQLTEEAV